MRRPRANLSRVRAAAGRAGAASRWGGRTAKATACLRVYPADAAEIRRRAVAAQKMPADIVADWVRGAEPAHLD